MRTPPIEAMAEAQPNIALVKYWGKRDDALNLPAAGSLSITLAALHTRTRIHFDAGLAADELTLNGKRDAGQTHRVGAFLDLFRRRAGTDVHARIESRNDFPTGAGLASSASGFAALAVAADHALGLALDRRELSILARRGSGSAARSIYGGFVEMAAGTRDDGTDAFAAPLLDATGWPLRVLVAITTRAPKLISSGMGMQRTRASSPFYRQWLATANADLGEARNAVASRDFAKLADVSEASCLAMHAAMLSARPGLVYWNAATVDCVHAIRALRETGTAAFFTIDAGPQVKAVCLPADAPRVAAALHAIAGVEDVLESALGAGARVTGTGG